MERRGKCFGSTHANVRWAVHSRSPGKHKSERLQLLTPTASRTYASTPADAEARLTVGIYDLSSIGNVSDGASSRPCHAIQKCAPVVGQLIWPLGVGRDWRSLAFGEASAQLLARCVWRRLSNRFPSGRERIPSPAEPLCCCVCQRACAA
ncbi:hypothetical protein MRX96_054590 [Rhipicephalus microplus]